jgi:energy-coupling factor transporter transmembrane protein EcfT
VDGIPVVHNLLHNLSCPENTLRIISNIISISHFSVEEANMSTEAKSMSSSSSNEPGKPNWVDFVVIALYFIFVLAVGLYVS